MFSVRRVGAGRRTGFWGNRQAHGAACKWGQGVAVFSREFFVVVVVVVVFFLRVCVLGSGLMVAGWRAGWLAREPGGSGR